MASTYTINDGLELIGVGEQNNLWGASLNNVIALVDQSLDGSVNIILTTNTYNLAVSDGQFSNGRNRVVEFTGTPSTTVSVSITPTDISKSYWIVNNSSQSLILSNGAGATYTVVAGASVPVYCDGEGNVTPLLQGPLTTGSIATTGTITAGTNLLVNGNATVDGALTVFGDGGFGSLSISGLTLSKWFSFSQIAINTVSVSSGSWIVVTIGTISGFRVMLAWGRGTILDGQSVPLPEGIVTAQVSASIGQIASGANQIENINISTSGLTVTAQASDNSGHNYTVTANWTAFGWAQLA